MPEQLIDDQAMRGIADVLRYVPGTTAAQGEGNRDQIVIRGNNTTADFFVDGIRDDAQIFRDLYNLERVEVLKGPAGMVFGRGGWTVWKDVDTGGGTAFIGTRPGCFINIIPAGGVVVQAEASSGCTCYQAIQCTVVLKPRE